MGYASWGSNDDSWGDNWPSNAGFETGDVTYSSGAQFWNTTVPSLSFPEIHSTGARNPIPLKVAVMRLRHQFQQYVLKRQETVLKEF